MNQIWWTQKSATWQWYIPIWGDSEATPTSDTRLAVIGNCGSQGQGAESRCMYDTGNNIENTNTINNEIILYVGPFDASTFWRKVVYT